MKKALAILLALSMVFAAFAGEPVVSNSVVEFKGDASLEWIYNLESEEFGLKNSANANLKINIVEGGDKATSGDGIWGELKIKVDGTSVNNGKVVVTKDDAYDGDVYNTKINDDGKYETTYDFTKLYPSASVDVAKIHFVDGDNAVVLNLVKQSLKLADGYEVGDLDAGFAVETSAKDIGSLTFKFQDNGVAKDKKYAYGADVSVSAIENASLSAKWANNGDLTTLGADASYDIAIDTSKLTPSVSYKMLNNGKTDDIDSQTLTAKVAFTWDGAEEVEVDYAGKGTGAWVSYTTDLDDADDDDSLEIAAYDNTLVDGLKVGAKYAVANVKKLGEGTASFGAKYGTAIDIVDLEVSGGVEAKIAEETTTKYKYAATVKTDDIIDNTTVYAKYEGEKDNKGKITVGAKIAL